MESADEEPNDLSPPEEKSLSAEAGIDSGSSGQEENRGVVPPEKGRERTGAAERPRLPQRPGEPDCVFYLRNGGCRFGMKCRFNHPPREKKNKVIGILFCWCSLHSGLTAWFWRCLFLMEADRSPDSDQATKEEQTGILSEVVPQTQLMKIDDNGKDYNSESSSQKSSETVEVKQEERVEQKESKVIEETDKEISSNKAAKEKGKEAVSVEGVQIECKYFSMPGGCKFGKSCRYFHREGKIEVGMAELNFLGLPIRPGEKECPFYMRTGSCKFSTNCRFHHPDPSVVGIRDPLFEYPNGKAPQHAAPGASQLHVASWPEPTNLNEPVTYLAATPSYPGMVPPQALHSNSSWNGYPVPMNPFFPAEIHVQHFPAPNVNHVPYPVQQQDPMNEYPERPGQPDCHYFVKNGFCKFKMACKFHHPKSRLSATTTGILNPLGLPVNPDRPACTYYGRYGICKFGPACKFDHPFDYGTTAPTVGSLPGPF